MNTITTTPPGAPSEAILAGRSLETQNWQMAPLQMRARRALCKLGGNWLGDMEGTLCMPPSRSLFGARDQGAQWGAPPNRVGT